MTLLTRLSMAGLALALAGTPVVADEPSTYRGGCGFDSVQQATVTGDTYVGAMHGALALYSPTHGNAVTATVTCEARVNGVVADSVSGSGSGVVVVAGDLAYTATDYDDFVMCTVVDYTSDNTPTTRDCRNATTMQFPPQESIDLLSALLDLADSVAGHAWTRVDPVVCPAFGALSPGDETVAITPEGDVYVAGEVLWDCPPYDEPLPEPWQPGSVPDLPGLPGHGPTGGGYDTGDAGLLALVTPESTAVAPEGPHAAAVCAFATGGDTVRVLGAVVAPGASSTSVRCRLLDAVDGTVLYDGTAATALRDSIPATGRPVTVCTSGSGDDAAVGEHCRPGAPV